VDLIDGQGRVFAHVYLWDNSDIKTFTRKVRAAFTWAVDTNTPMSKQHALFRIKQLLTEYTESMANDPRSFTEWLKLFKHIVL
jgi:hypothetical protein